MTLRDQKMHPHTKFGIPTSYNVRDMLVTQLFLKLGHISRPCDLKMVHDTSSTQDLFTH